MTPRARAVLEKHREEAGKPLDGFVRPAPTKSGHIDHSTLKKQHTKIFGVVNQEAKKNNQRLLKPFVLYSF